MKSTTRYLIIFLALVVVTLFAFSILDKNSNNRERKDNITNGQEEYTPSINSSNFVTEVDNPYFTLTPGITYTYQSETDEGAEKNIVIVTNQTKDILGITNVVVWDRVWLEDKLAEETYDWYAQDKEGNVWYFGEDSKEYDNGKVSSTEGSWEAGIDDAKPGIIMEANPKVGDSYRQEYYKEKAEDMADVLAVGENVTVPYGKFNNCIKTRDWSKIESDVNEYKYYCKEVGGVVLEVTVSSGERAELINVTR